MSVIIYGIKNCNTMKKAMDTLTELGIDYTLFDYKKQPISQEKIQQWVSELGLENVLNKKGMTWRNLPDEQKTLALSSESEAIKVMADKPSMIKRPLIAYQQNGDEQYLVGYDEKKYQDILG